MESTVCHMEAQMKEDETIILRVFDYGYSHALRNATEREGKYRISFPEPKVIYLYTSRNVPDEYELELDFGKQGQFMYKVTVCKFQEITTEELNERKMVILIPFALLRVRALLKKNRSPENKELLKALIQNDIIDSINENLKVGNITVWDARKLKSYTHKLYEEIYSNYEGMEELNEMTDESLMLDVDIIEKKMEELEKRSIEKEEILTKINKELDKKGEEISKKDEEISKKDEEISKKDEEIERLRAALAKAGIQA